MRLH
jgi:hypothetical protein